ncbi:MAG: HAMP domain-containing histidine kinase, partial [Bacteroidales bacterium]|nr:HAMP domain-containing histidine kinase [Bacteroidales bacterium]
MKYASGKADSAKSINAVGRVNLKMKDFTKAYSSYSRITSEFPSVLDNNGFPYFYYAILNLLEISKSNHTIHVVPEIGSFLEGMIRGIVPMNSSTSDILARISAWKDHSGMIDSAQNTHWDETISKIERNIRFFNNYSKTIKTSVGEQRKGESQLQLGRFLVLNDPAVEPGRIVLIYPGKEHFPGFCIDLDSLWSDFMATAIAEETEFDYSVSLIGKELIGPQGNDQMVHSRLLSSYFPEYEIRIELQDENLIDTFVKKRRWTYGIALFLLLGAMLMGILLILRDLLREKYLNKLKSDFVSNVTHELKTPLTSIHLFAESVLLDRVDSESGKKEYLQIILKETERLKRIINNILDFSKKEKGKIEYKIEKVDVTALIRSALNDLNYWLEELDFTVHTELEEGAYVSGDPDALKQVVINLLDNAIKY